MFPGSRELMKWGYNWEGLYILIQTVMYSKSEVEMNWFRFFMLNTGMEMQRSWISKITALVLVSKDSSLLS